MLLRHQPAITGTWFPGDPVELQDLLDRLFVESEHRTGEALRPGAWGFLVPHAGLVYSGTVASAVYRNLQAQKPKRVVLLGFSHSRFLSGLCTPDLDIYETPAGDIPVDRPAVEALLRHHLFHRMPEPAVCDHSLEIQLPLLAKAAPETPLVPLYVGLMTPAERHEASVVLRDLHESGTVFVASSDLTHYGRHFHYQPFAADKHVADRLRALDNRILEAAASLDPDFFLEELKRTDATMCGYLPVALLLELLRTGETPEVFQETLDYQTSGELTGDFSSSVSYGAAGYYPAGAFFLKEAEQQALLESACATLDRLQTTGDRTPVPPSCELPALERRTGVFVSLHQNGELRGCLGCRSSLRPLSQAVPELALAAALSDPRFEPLQPGEAPCTVEISLLTPMKRLIRREQFRLHEHGAYLELGAYSGLLLPQVTWNRRWDRDAFFRALAQKAGVTEPIDSRPGLRLYLFRAQVFGDEARIAPPLVQ